jgi:hypothetical protein
MYYAMIVVVASSSIRLPHNISICNTNDRVGVGESPTAEEEPAHTAEASNHLQMCVCAGDNHKSKLLTSCFRPISWQHWARNQDNAGIAILLCTQRTLLHTELESSKKHTKHSVGVRKMPPPIAPYFEGNKNFVFMSFGIRVRFREFS